MLGAGRPPARRQPERREDAALAEAGPQPAHPGRHEADGADRHRRRAELRPHRGDGAPLRQEHDRQPVPPHPRPEGLRARLRPVVPLRDAGGPVGVRGERRAPARLREDPGREREGERQGRGGGDTAGEGSGHLEPDPADGRGARSPTRRWTRRSTTGSRSSSRSTARRCTTWPTPRRRCIQVSPTSWYAVENGVWFTAAAPAGPWAVATSVPSVIYTIPPSSPVHYVTYVKVYQSTPTTVTTGYTPGYYGTVVSNGTVVYGTGYAYPPYVGSTVWYGPPITYGSGVGITYTPWTGWTYGFGMGWSWGAVTVGWGWGAYPWWGPVGYGYYYPYPYYRPPYWGGGRPGARGAAAPSGDREAGPRRPATSTAAGARRVPSRAARAATTPGRATRGATPPACPTTRAPATSPPASAPRSATCTAATTPTAAAAGR